MDIIVLQMMCLRKLVGYFHTILPINAAEPPVFIPKQESTDIRNQEKKA